VNRDEHKQLEAAVRFDWGLTGATAVAPKRGCLVVVDVLSFTTAVTVATGRGMSVFPYRWRDESAARFAALHDATLAAERRKVTPHHPWSLSPSALQNAPITPRLVLPSPNGSTIAASCDGLVVAASLRNARSVGERLVKAGYGTASEPVTVVAAGERWGSDDSLRPCLEDQLGAGAVITAMIELGCSPSPEAAAAASCFLQHHDIPATLLACASGRELVEDGFGCDVEVACEVDVDSVVPVLVEEAFIPASDELLRLSHHYGGSPPIFR
jgi:2-phosphosulfolactate phosphatase